MDKKWFYGLILVFLIVLAWLTLSDFQFNSKNNSTKLNLDYQAKKEFDPELAVITLGVETNKKDLKLAFLENNKKMSEITRELNNIENISISTLNFTVIPRNVLENDKKVLYFNVLNQIEVKSEQLDNLSLIIQKAIDTGANQILSIEYSLKNLNEAKKQVTEEALKGIRDKARFVTQKLDKNKFEISSLDINDQYFDRNFFQYRTKGELMSEALPTSFPPISPQKIELVVNINAIVSLY